MNTKDVSLEEKITCQSLKRRSTHHLSFPMSHQETANGACAPDGVSVHMCTSKSDLGLGGLGAIRDAVGRRGGTSYWMPSRNCVCPLNRAPNAQSRSLKEMFSLGPDFKGELLD